MENKNLTQELNLIEKLLQLVNSKEEYDCLVAEAKEICPSWIAPHEKESPEHPELRSSLLKGGAINIVLDKMIKIVTIKGKPVIDIYESFDGSYWYITEKLYTQDSIIDGKVYKNDQILFGYAKLSACPQFAEFGNISEAELRLMCNRIWKVPKSNWHLCPDVELTDESELTGRIFLSASIIILFSKFLKGGG